MKHISRSNIKRIFKEKGVLNPLFGNRKSFSYRRTSRKFKLNKQKDRIYNVNVYLPNRIIKKKNLLMNSIIIKKFLKKNKGD